MSKQKPESVVLDIDALTEEQIHDRLTQTLQHIAAIKQLWPGLVRLSEKDRMQSPGRQLKRLSEPLQTLFSLLVTRDGKETALGRLFHVLGNEDRGVDPARFEPELLLRRMRRVDAQTKLLEELEDFSRHLGDDMLSTSEAVLAPGQLALALARAVAKGNAEHRSALAPVLDALASMTKTARQRQRRPAKPESPAPSAAAP